MSIARFRKFFFLPSLLLLAVPGLIYPGQQKGEKSMPLSAPDEFWIVIKKGQRRLHLYRQGQGLIKTYPVALGFQPIGHKTRQGDGATPEGAYYLTHKNPKSKFYLSLGISYPNIDDAAGGLRRKIISTAEYDAIVSANRNRSKPPQQTGLGGDIFLHGGGTKSDWTWGCIALEDEMIRELFDLLPLGTPINIER